jgi:hypothetical protein
MQDIDSSWQFRLDRSPNDIVSSYHSYAMFDWDRLTSIRHPHTIAGLTSFKTIHVVISRLPQTVSLP